MKNKEMQKSIPVELENEDLEKVSAGVEVRDADIPVIDTDIRVRNWLYNEIIPYPDSSEENVV